MSPVQKTYFIMAYWIQIIVMKLRISKCFHQCCRWFDHQLPGMLLTDGCRSLSLRLGGRTRWRRPWLPWRMLLPWTALRRTTRNQRMNIRPHGNVMAWKRFQHYRPYVRGIHRCLVESIPQLVLWCLLCCSSEWLLKKQSRCRWF